MLSCTPKTSVPYSLKEFSRPHSKSDLCKIEETLLWPYLQIFLQRYQTTNQNSGVGLRKPRNICNSISGTSTKAFITISGDYSVRLVYMA